jgi:thioesterase domain-containing protein
MSTVKKLLTDLHNRNVQLWVEGDRLCYRAPKGALTTALKTQMQKYKAKILPLLKSVHGKTGSLISESVLVPIRAEGNQAPLFCIHPVGGDVLCYAGLTSHLDPERPLYGLQSQGLAGLQPPLSHIEEMAECYLEELRAVQPQGPYHLVGWSLGGLIAFEMAQQLQQQGDTVSFLALIDSYAPTAMKIPEELDYAGLLLAMLKNLSGLVDRELPISLGELRAVEPQAQLSYVLKLAQQHQLLPSAFTLTHFEHLWEVFLANLTAAAQYQPQPYEGTAILFRASQSDEMESPSEVNDDNGWGALILRELKVCSLSGDHYSLMRSPQVAVLAEQIEEAIYDCQKPKIQCLTQDG